MIGELIVGVALAADPTSVNDLVVVADPEFGMEGGVRTFESAGRVILHYDRLLPTPEHPVLALGARALQSLFVDLPLVETETAFIHEVYGHGARGREFDRHPTYAFKLPAPYRAILSPDDHDAHGATTDFGGGSGGQRDQDLPGTFGGIESNLWTSHVIATRLVANGGNAHHAELAVYTAKILYAGSFFGSDLERLGGNDAGDDVGNYVTQLQDRFNRWRPEDRVSIARHLRTAYLWNFVDPVLAWAAWANVVEFFVRGHRDTTMPLPRAHGVTFLPQPRFSMSPFGAEHYLDLFFAKDGAVVDLYGRAGSSGLARYDGAGVRVLGVHPHPNVSLGAELDVWSQPETLLHERAVYDRAQVAGANAGAFATFYVADHFGVTGKLAVKSRGYLMAQPIDAGPYGYVGIAYRP